MEALLTADWGQTLQRLQDLIRNPQSNVVASILLLAAFSIVVLLIMLTIGAIFLGGGDDDDEWEDDEEYDAQESEYGPAVGSSGEPIEQDLGPQRPFSYRLGLLLAWTLLVVGAVWVIAGVTTGQNSVCMSCHAGSAHAKSKADPHQAVRCVACHERGGVVGSVTTAVPTRTAHLATELFRVDVSTRYGHPVSSSSCVRCHRAGISETMVVDDRGIRISHREPLDAGAECIDCHALADGVVSNHTVGMAACLRCHDGTVASTECELCHTRPIGTAAEPGQSTSKRSLDRIGQPDCGTCHDQTSCDACHGVRMPHSKEFMAFGHARAGAQDIWDNGGTGCAKCHNATQRPCTQCHITGFPQHPASWRTLHGGGGPNNNACICHERMAYMQGRNFCGLCHEVTKEDGVWKMAPE